MRKRGEITVFLSLTIVCVLSLFMGLLESARTAGARLYLQMAADSSMASVMSQYNRNLWDMYHLLFLEYESEDAVEQSFMKYFEYYLEQENLYPMEMKDLDVTETAMMMEDGGKALEQEILSYVKYRLPDIAADIAGIMEEAVEVKKAGDFRELFKICRQAGRKTRKLEKSRIAVEDCLKDMEELLENVENAAAGEREGAFERNAGLLETKMKKFPGLVRSYETEVQNISEYRLELEADSGAGLVSDMADMETEAAENLEQELAAYDQVLESAQNQLQRYEEMGQILEDSLVSLENAVEVFEETRYEEDEIYIAEDGSVQVIREGGPAWGEIRDYLSDVEIPKSAEVVAVDQERVRALDKLEDILQGELLTLVLPEGVEISGNHVTLNGIPSDSVTDSGDEGEGIIKNAEALLEKYMVNEYCFLSFDSFLEQCVRTVEIENQALQYEQEYLLCGKASDRENLAGTVEWILSVRGAMNLLFLLNSPDMRADVDGLVAAVSGGNLPIQFILSFFILALWAFGEAVWDVKCLLSGGKVSFLKNRSQWNLSLEELLELKFLEAVPEEKTEGCDYEDYLRVLFLLMNSEQRNFRIMDVIQWNIRTVQNDFAVVDCASQVEIEAKVYEKHLFLVKDKYTRSVKTVGSY